MKSEGFVKVNDVMTLWRVENKDGVECIVIDGCSIEIPIQEEAIKLIRLWGSATLEDMAGNDVSIPIEEMDEIIEIMETKLKEVG